MESLRKGKFITFEGCDGAGKSTQIKMLADYLDKEGILYLLTREPGGGKISEAIRSIILDGKNADMTDECEALLFAAARVQHLSDTVEPALKEGKLVLCDRYVDSSFAYQATARGLGEEFISKINAFALEHFLPDLTVFIDLTPKDAFIRKHGADQNDRMEQAGMFFHEKVYEGFISRVKGEPERFYCVDGKQTPTLMHEEILSALKKRNILK
ncbi:MAG: dTMP kinase [Clostridia bacterium]|nr:dTMP kinase [Clostridia bacterium]